MNPEDDTRTMPAGEPRPPDSKTKLLIIALVLGVIIVSGVIFLLTRALGGDEPAPQLESTAAATANTKPGAAAGTQAGTGPPVATARLGQTQSHPPMDIHHVNWNQELEPVLSGGSSRR